MKKIEALLIFNLLIICLLLFTGCGQKQIEELTRYELFSLGIGKMDNQVDLFQIEGDLFNQKNRIYMRDGLFYIANGNSAKIMEFSSYGDLIFLLYNPEKNPQPVSFSSTNSKDMASTRKALPYPLISIGELVVDSKKRVYVEDIVPEDRQVKDKELGVILDKVILRFDRHGNQLEFIGQEGLGGSPFPYIDRIYITVNNDLVVICRIPQAWIIFWYSEEGTLLYNVEIDHMHLPIYESREEVITSVARMIPDLKQPLLYLMLHYYHNTIDESTKQTTAIENFTSRIYSLNMETGKYGNSIEIPQNGQVGTRQIEVPPPSYELIGINLSGHFFLLRLEDASLFHLIILDRYGRIVSRRYLVMEDSEFYFKDIKISDSGLIYALLCEKYEAKVVWWRSDKLLKE